MLNYKKSFLWNVLLVTLCATEIAVAQPNVTAPALFSDAGGAKPKHSEDLSFTLVRTRSVRINMAVLFDKTWKAKGADRLPKIRFDLFPGISVVGKVTAIVRHEEMGTTYWGGTLLNATGDFAITADKLGAVMDVAIYNHEKGNFRIDCDETYLCNITQVDVSKLPNED